MVFQMRKRVKPNTPATQAAILHRAPVVMLLAVLAPYLYPKKHAGDSGAARKDCKWGRSA